MKKFLFLLALLVLLADLSANIFVPRYVARVWFDAADSCHVMFGSEAWWDGFDVNDVSFTTSAGTYYLPQSYVQPSETVFVINLNKEIPGFTVQRNEDFLCMTIPTIGYQQEEELRWGPQNDFSVHMHALGPGQSAVHVQVSDYFGHGEYDTMNFWAKDSQTVSPNPYQPVSHYTLGIHLEDGNGTPAAGIQIYTDHFDYATVCDQYYMNPTNQFGNWERTKPAIRRSILVRDPQTTNPVIQELLFPEPGETIQLSGVVSSVSSHDPVQTPPTGVLSLYPSVLSLSSGNTLSLKYKTAVPLGQEAELRIYDLRGRFLSGKEMPSDGETVWDLPDLSSGIYFIALSAGDRILARSRITVFK